MIKPNNPLFTRTGILLTLGFLGVLGISLWKDRGLVFSPGPVTEHQRDGITLQGFNSHAEFEKECRYCHMPLEATVGEMCLLCHVDIAEQISKNEGVHALVANVSSCQDCHSEHKGRNFDPTLSAMAFFDHTITRFSLQHHQLNYDAIPMTCDTCHGQGDYTRDVLTTCQNCHGIHDLEFIQVHISDYGARCLDCHDGIDQMQDFDHDQTAFTLDGMHTQIVCSACHIDGQTAGMLKTCQGCHAEPDLHRGLFDQDCESCHNSQAWSPASIDGQPFDHLDNAGFSLVKHSVDFSGQSISCATCHPANLRTFKLALCSDCHFEVDPGFMDQHRQQYGMECLVCHDGVDRMHGFDHAMFFPLNGRHAEIECNACHVNQVFRGTPAVCSQCHAEPEIHVGVFGVECQACHSTIAWSPATLLEHAFPLRHGLGAGAQPTACITCHSTSYVEYTCYGCHEHQAADIARKHNEEGISSAELAACVTCHPTGQEVEGDD